MKISLKLIVKCFVYALRDVGRVIEATFEDTHPPCVLIGHSMGGAVGVHTAYNQYIAGIYSFCYICVKLIEYKLSLG